MLIAQVLVGASKQLKQIIQIENDTLLKESQLAGGKPVGYLQAWPGIWTRGYRETNPGSGQGGTRFQDCCIASPTRWPLTRSRCLVILRSRALCVGGIWKRRFNQWCKAKWEFFSCLIINYLGVGNKACEQNTAVVSRFSLRINLSQTWSCFKKYFSTFHIDHIAIFHLKKCPWRKIDSKERKTFLCINYLYLIAVNGLSREVH